MIVNKLNNRSIELTISSLLYNEAIIHKCFYWYSDQLTIDIKLKNDNFLVSIINFPEELNFEKILSSIKRDLIDFKTRDIIASETADIRALLIAKAFAHSDEFDEKPPGVLDDPLGFNPLNF